MFILVDQARERHESHVSLRAYEHYRMMFEPEAQREISKRIRIMIREGKKTEKGIQILGEGSKGSVVCAVEHKGFWIPAVYAPDAECLVTIFPRGSKWETQFREVSEKKKKSEKKKRLKFYDE